MHGNKQAYEAAFQRARQGKAARNLWEKILSPLEDTYTRDSRERGWRDGKAALEAQEAAGTPVTEA